MTHRFCGVALFFFAVSLFGEEVSLVTPCRLLDTRNVGGVLATGVPRNFSVRGTPGAAQGGLSGCGVPEDATGVLMNVVAVSPAGAGYLEVYRYGVQPVTASRLNYTAASGALANEMVVQLAQPSYPYDFTILAQAATTHVLADVIGFLRGLPNEDEAFSVRGVVAAHTSGTPPLFLTIDLDPSTLGCSGIASECLQMECSAGGEVDCAQAVNGQCGRVIGHRRISSPGLLPAILDSFQETAFCLPDPPRQQRFIAFVSSPPGSPNPGDRMVVTSGSGAFAGRDDEWVTWDGAGWVFDFPRDGDLGFEASNGTYWRYRALGTPGWKQLAEVP